MNFITREEMSKLNNSDNSNNIIIIIAIYGAPGKNLIFPHTNNLTR